MKIEVINSKTFAVDGNRYQRGDFAIDYRNDAVKIVNKFTSAVIGGGNDYSKWDTFTDSASAKYANYAAFVTALSTITTAADAETTIANDKGTVTQATSKTTGVTLNNLSGVITTVALTDAADAGFEFTVTNSKVTSASIVLLTSIYAGTTGKVKADIKSVSNGSFVVVITNVGTAVLNALAKVQFAVFG